MSQYVWLIFIFVSLIMPWMRGQQIQSTRLKTIIDFQRKRGSRLITLIHRQETMSFFGIPLSRSIDIEDSEDILRAIRMTPADRPIDLLLHTPGGLVLATAQIAEALRRHPAKVTVFVPHYAMSGGTMLALAANEIIMDENAVLGPLDPQLGRYPAVSILRAVARKDINQVSDETLILADVAEKAMRQVYNTVLDLLNDHLSEEKARQIAAELTEGNYTHDFPLTCEMLRAMGLNVTCPLPVELHQLMALYPQAANRRPSVQYVPMD
jgi:ClpP class serine protease